MHIGDAVIALKSLRSVRRESWPPETHIRLIVQSKLSFPHRIGGVERAALDPFILLQTATITGPYIITDDDLLANDWSFYGEGPEQAPQPISKFRNI